MKKLFPFLFALLLIGCENDNEDLTPNPGGGGNDDPAESGPDQFFEADLDGEPFLMEADANNLILPGMVVHQINCFFNYGMTLSDGNDPFNEPIVTIMHYLQHFETDCTDEISFSGLWSTGTMEFAEMEGDDVGQGIVIELKPANTMVTYSSAHGPQPSSMYNITEVINLGEDYINTQNTFGPFIGLKETVQCTLYATNGSSETIEVTNGEFYTLVQGLN